MDGAFVNLMRGSRLKLYLGIDPDANKGQFAQDYTSISFGVEVVSINNSSSVPQKPTTKTAKAPSKAVKLVEEPTPSEEAEFVLRVKCGHLAPRKYRVAVDCSPALVYSTSGLHFPRNLEPGDDGELLIRARAPADTNFTALGQCVRLSQYT
jgi:hypothetical protein